MTKQAYIPKVVLTIPLIMAAMMAQAAPAFADWGHRHNDHYDSHDRYRHYPQGRSAVFLPYGSISISFGGGSFYYGDGRFYRRRANDYLIVSPPVGAVVYSVPVGCRRVIVRGVSYYSYDDVYYRQVSGGYQVVDEPVLVEQERVSPQPVSDKPQDAFTVNIPNSNSGYTTVTLKRSGQGYVGPQGEYYPEFPQS